MTRRISRRTLRDAVYFVLAFGVVLCAALFVAYKTGARLLDHSAFDSYAKQAMAWRDGRVMLDGDYPWLELAIFEGNYYVSFPPVPTIPMWILSFFVGENTPSGLMTLLYFLGGFVALFFLLRRHFSGGQAAVTAVFVSLGGSLLDLAVSGEAFSGGVWFQAQLLGYLFTVLAFLLVDGRRKAGWAIGLICIALAVGCRPFNALYVPVLLWMLYKYIEKESLWKTLLAAMPYVIVPALIACAYGVYNYARFGNPLEFGHAYLPELAQAGEGMFVPSRIWDNILNILRPIEFHGNAMYMAVVSGCAVYLTNPVIFMSAERGVERAIRRKGDVTDILLAIVLVIHALALLSHRTNGGWQYGTRYLCDLLPALAFLFARGKQPLRHAETLLMGGLIVINILGTIAFHAL